jgi:hypothetical protein
MNLKQRRIVVLSKQLRKRSNMKNVLLAAVAALTLLSSAHAAPGDNTGTSVVSATATPKSVVVELFTSEGCSSCPPADVVLAKLDKMQASDVKVIALGEHVDYWNRLGWRDPFSDASFSNRQSEYARAFHNDQVYTPQMVVQGRSEFVGSDEVRAKSEIDLSAHDASQFVPLTLTVHSRPGRKIEISVNAPATRGGNSDGSIFYAVTQDGLSSDVARGENAGRKLNHAAVVRRMDRLATYDSGVGTSNVSKTISLKPETDLRGLHVVAFIQRANTGAIVSAAEVDLKGLSSDAVATRR